MINASGSESTQRRDYGFIPVDIRTIASIMRPGKPYMLGSEVANVVTLVTRVELMKENSGSIDFVFRDHTGTFNGITFKKSGTTLVKPLINYGFVKDGYAFVIGSLSNFENTDKIVVSRMMNLSDYSYVTLHRTQVLWAYLVRSGVIHDVSNQKAMKNLEEQFAETEGNEDFAGLAPEQLSLMKFLKENDPNNSGIKKEFAVKHFKGNAENVKTMLLELANYGYLYSDSECEIYYRT